MNMNLEFVKVLEKFWPKNKAKGILAQTIFKEEMARGVFGADAKEKMMSGCWLFAPKSSDFFKFLFSFFIHPEIVKADAKEADLKAVLGDKYRPLYAIAEFMNNAGIGIIYAVPHTKNGKLEPRELKKLEFGNIEWQFLSFEEGKFISRDSTEFFNKWPGSRGRASRGGGWEPHIKAKIRMLKKEILLELLMNELFYAGFLKGILRKPVNDPYDVDSFLMSLSQKHIFPMEIKEKFPGQNREDKFFGIDAGRVMMLLRICLPNDANAIYLIREVDKRAGFVGWKYITLSDIIMTSSWNLQAGGRGMGGQDTQTIRLPYDYFKEFDSDQISEDALQRIGSLPKEVKTAARQFCDAIHPKFYS